LVLLGKLAAYAFLNGGEQQFLAIPDPVGIVRAQISLEFYRILIIYGWVFFLSFLSQLPSLLASAADSVICKALEMGWVACRVPILGEQIENAR